MLLKMHKEISLKSIDIATEYYSKSIKYSIDIFLTEKNFFDICFWARESCREVFCVNPLRYDMIRKIDDIGIEVDRYMHKTRFRILKNAQLGKNSLAEIMDNPKKVIRWFIARWINVFMNLATNKKYKNYIDVGLIGYELNENMSHFDNDSLSLIIKEEEKLELEKQQKRMKKCNSLIKMLDDGKVGGESTESGGTQMIFIF